MHLLIFLLLFQLILGCFLLKNRKLLYPMSGGLVLLPLSGYLVDHVGYFAVYLVVISFAVLSLICFETALALAKKQGRAI